MIERSKFVAPLAFVLALSFSACAGEATDSGDGDGDGDGDSTGDGDVTGDGDGDIVGDGDGDVVGDGDGDVVGDGDGDVIICTDNYVYGLGVTVIGGGVDPGGNSLELIPPEDPGIGGSGAGGSTGDLVPAAPCYATVVAVDGDYMETLECYATGTDCQCYGAGERPGNYSVTATLGDMVELETALVTSDECHVQSVQITFFD